jgi:hypothetical protein
MLSVNLVPGEFAAGGVRDVGGGVELAERVAGGTGPGFTPSRVRRTRQPYATMQTCAMTVVPG